MTTFLAWCFAHPKIAGGAIMAVILATLIGGFYAFAHHQGVASQAPKVAAAQEQARTATAQTSVTASAAAAADTASTTAAQATAKAQEAAHDVQAAPGAGVRLDPELRARWLRGQAASAGGAGGRQPAPAVRPSAGR